MHFCGQWFHVGFHKFNPRRPMFLECTLRATLTWQHRVIDPVYSDKNGQGTANVRTVHAALKDCNLEVAQSLELFRLVAFDRPLPGFRPDKELTIAPLSSSIDSVPETICFWRGRAEEIKESARQKEQKRATDARRRQRAADARGPAPVPRVKPQVHLKWQVLLRRSSS